MCFFIGPWLYKKHKENKAKDGGDVTSEPRPAIVSGARSERPPSGHTAAVPGGEKGYQQSNAPPA